MENQITIREAVTETDVALFWKQLYAYYDRDIFPDPADADRAYFLDEAYRSVIQTVHDRAQDRGYFLFFSRNGQDIGFALPVIFHTEDGKCFIMEFCVYPEYRGGTGTDCAAALLRWAGEHGACYAELNYGEDPRRLRFWQRVGFRPNGLNEWGDTLLTYPPKGIVPITVEVLADGEDWQLRKLENGFRAEIGEQPLTAEGQAQLAQALRDGKITFFFAKRGYRAVGMCSVARCWSTFAWGETGVFDDFFVEPVFRGQGVARKLALAAQAWCREQGMASLTVTCAPCDEGMYQSLGFSARLGSAYANILK